MMVMHEADRAIRMTLPPEVQQTTHQAVTAASCRSVLTALIITACQLMTTPQSSPNTEIWPMAAPPA
jgi:hypothetical protein